MPRHAVMQAAATRQEAFRLGIVDAVDQPHVLAHHVAMEPRRAERVLRRPSSAAGRRRSRRSRSRRIRRRRQHGEDRRIGMVEADRVDRVEAREVVLVRRVVAVPRDDVERRVVDRRAPQPPAELRDQLERALGSLVRRDRRQEVARIGEAVRADRAELGQPEQRAVVLADVAARRRIAGASSTANSHAARQTARFRPGSTSSDAELGRDAQRALLRNDQHLTVGVVEDSGPSIDRLHGIHVDRDARLRRGVAVAARSSSGRR